MIRCAYVIAMLVGVALAQPSAPSSPLVAKTTNASGDVSIVSPGSIATVDTGSVRAVPGLEPLPKGKVTLMGGTIQSVDLVRDRMVVQVFGGRRTTVLFDERTRMFRDGKSVSLGELQKGERAYVDTTLDGTDIFARSISIAAGAAPAGQSSGQIVSFDIATGELRLRDTLSPEPVTMRVAVDARIVNGDRSATLADLRPGALVSLTFDPVAGKSPKVRQVSILASPGTTFFFVGRVEHIDLRRGLLVIVDPRDNKNYDLYFDPASRGITRQLTSGSNVTVEASFNGTRYESRNITVNPSSPNQQQQQ